MRSTFAFINSKNVQLPSVWFDALVRFLFHLPVCVFVLWFDEGKVRVNSDNMEALPKTIIRVSLTSICVPVRLSLIVKVFS